TGRIAPVRAAPQRKVGSRAHAHAGAGALSQSFPRRSMNKFSSLLMLSLTAGALLTGCGNNDSAPAAQSAAPAPTAPTKIVIGLDDNFPPMGFRNEKNELVGFDIDLAKEAAKRLGIEVEFKPIDWSAK